MGSATSSLFDFPAYLTNPDVQNALSEAFGQSLVGLGPADWEITKLTGGLINVTVRAALNIPPEPGSGTRAVKRGSVVMKYAPPYIAAVGEAVPFGTFRQVIEARALKLLNSIPSIVQSQFETRVQIPKLLWFDAERHILVLEDLGDGLSTLDEWLPSIYAADHQTETGARLGTLLARIHTDEALHAALDSGEFVNQDAVNLVSVEVIGKIRGILAEHLETETASIVNSSVEDEAELISGIIREEFERQKLDADSARVMRRMFSMGDCWVGSVLFGPADAGGEPFMALIDWEFAGKARALHDMAQLGAWLYMLSRACAWTPGEETQHKSLEIPRQSERVKASQPWEFARSLFTAYAQSLASSAAHGWLVKVTSESPEEESARLQVIRGAWILFGQELVYSVVDATHWFGKLLPAEHIIGWKKEVLEFGWRYVRRAGISDDADFEVAMEQEEFLKPIYIPG